MEENAVILANGTVIACDPTSRAGRLHLVVRDGRIQEMGGALDALTTMYPTATVVDVSDHLIIPGFVNAHYHTESFLLQEVTGQKPFSTWKSDRRLRTCAESLAEATQAEHLRTIAATSYRAHLKSGTTSIAEFPPPVDHRGLESLLGEAESAGLRTVPILQLWDQINHVREGKSNLRNVMVGLGREEDYTVYSFENFVRAARDLNAPIAAHIAEQRDDADLVRKNFSKMPVVLLRDFGALHSSTLIVHLNHGSPDDADLVSASGASVVLCAASSALKQCGYPFLRLLAGRRMRLCVGTDWGSVDMFGELRFLRGLPRLFVGMPEFGAMELVRMATINGAAALGIDDVTGSIEVGKLADLTMFSLADVRRMPGRPGDSAEECADSLLRFCSADCVSHVMVKGRFVVRDGSLTGFDERKAVAAFRATRDALISGEDQESRTAAARPKIYAFAAGERKLESEGEDFVEGLRMVPKPVPVSPPVVPQRADEPATQRDTTARPGVTKEIKKVFGEDDDV